MEYFEYLRPSESYFWQWEDNMEVAAIPGGSTIVYREYLTEAVRLLAQQGLPPLGALLLALIATNPSAAGDMRTVAALADKALGKRDDPTLKEALHFLDMLAQVPEIYKTGGRRILLLQAVFEDCHNSVAVKHAEKIAQQFAGILHAREILSRKKPFSPGIFERDFRTIGLLLRRYPDLDSLLQRVNSLPQLLEPVPLDDSTTEEEGYADLVEELEYNRETFHAGALVRRIWSGLHIPVHSALPGVQPLGGVADITNKGDLDKLLISEYANDELAFLSRLANNEALYIQREVPPAKHNRRRMILVDVSLKNWGTPRTVAYAVSLAIALHPKTDIACSVFAVGARCYPLSIDTADAVTDALRLLDGTLHAAAGCAAFFEAHKQQHDMEVIMITSAAAARHSQMQQVLSTYHAAINYLIYTDELGNIDVYKKQQASRKLLQHMQLPLEELWTPRKPKSRLKPMPADIADTISGYPLLFRNPLSYKAILPAADGEVFMVTTDRCLMRRYSRTGKSYEKGWELIKENLVFGNGAFGIGLSSHNEWILLVLDIGRRELSLHNLEEDSCVRTDFAAWDHTAGNYFAFSEDAFYYTTDRCCWKVALDGKVTQGERTSYTDNLRKEQQEHVQEIARSYAYSQPVFKNIKDVFIDGSGALVFNIHRLGLDHGHLKLVSNGIQSCVHRAERKGDAAFVFADGSRIKTQRLGMLVLQSSNKQIPDIYLPTALDASLGAATHTSFAGNEYYFKDPQKDLVLKEVPHKMDLVKLLRGHTDMSLASIQELVSGSMPVTLTTGSEPQMLKLLKLLQAERVHVALQPSVKWQVLHSLQQDRLGISHFYQQYIEAFIRHIRMSCN